MSTAASHCLCASFLFKLPLTPVRRPHRCTQVAHAAHVPMACLQYEGNPCVHSPEYRSGGSIGDWGVCKQYNLYSPHTPWWKQPVKPVKPKDVKKDRGAKKEKEIEKPKDKEVKEPKNQKDSKVPSPVPGWDDPNSDYSKQRDRENKLYGTRTTNYIFGMPRSYWDKLFAGQPPAHLDVMKRSTEDGEVLSAVMDQASGAGTASSSN